MTSPSSFILHPSSLPSRLRVLTPAEKKALTEALRHPKVSLRFKVLYALAWISAARIHELLSLTLGDVTDGEQLFDELVLRRESRKGGKPVPTDSKLQARRRRDVRDVVIPLVDRDGSILDLLAAYLSERRRQSGGELNLDEPLFATSSLKSQVSSLSRENADKELRAFCRRAGVAPFGFHTIRRSRATLEDRAGRSIQHIQRLLGHRQVNTTYRYTELDNRALEDMNRGFSLGLHSPRRRRLRAASLSS